MKKSIICKICILLVMLAAVTFAYIRQDVTVRVTLSEDTIIRPGQRLAATVMLTDGEHQPVSAGTPYYSIYEYEIKIPAGIWRDSSQVKLEFGQVRRGDHIYVESVSVKQPFFNGKTFNTGIIYQQLFNIISADISMTGSGLLDIEVLATRAHTSSGDTEGPGFSLPAETIKTPGTFSFVYVFCVLAAIAVWMLFSFFVPRGTYKLILIKLHEFITILRSLALIDIALLLTGVMSVLLNFYGRDLLRDYSGPAYNIFSFAIVALIIIKYLSTVNRNDAQPKPAIYKAGASVASGRMIYLLLIILGAVVYIPAAFPNPYFVNDEFQVIGAAEWYIANGNFDQYSRAWPHTWLVAQTIKLFGLSTVSTRMLSALFGILFIVSVYYIFNKLTGKRNIALLSALLLLCNPNLISIFTTVRMYAVMLPLSLWMFYCLYTALHREPEYKKDNAVTRFMKTQFNVHPGYTAAALILAVLNYIIHVNSMTFVICAYVYVIITAIIKRQRKFINLSLLGAGLLTFSIVIYVLEDFRIRIPVVSRAIKDALKWVTNNVSFGVNNFRFFWNNISAPLGTYLGIIFLLIAFAALIFMLTDKRKKPGYIIEYRKIIAYSALTYLGTIIFFVFLADWYFSSVYMAFLLPITMLLISAGYNAVSERASASTRLVMHMLIAAAIIFQMSSTFTRNYIDDPGATKFDRPYQILNNDAKNEQLDAVPVFSTFSRRYFNDIVENGYRAGSMAVESGQVYELDKWVRNIDFDHPVMYFFSEESKMWHTRGINGEFLGAATDLITTIDSSVVRKYHVTEASLIGESFQTTSSGSVLTVVDVKWEDDVAYLQCEMRFIPVFETAVFIAVEVTEQGLAQSATHRYQVFVPDDFRAADILEFTLTVRPKTEEYSENITFNMSGLAYVYYGENKSAVTGLAP